MVATSKNPAASSTTQPQNAQSWWNDVSPLCSEFFTISTEFNHQSQKETQTALLQDMAEVYQGVKHVAYPVEIEGLRTDLLKSMDGLMKYFTRELNSDKVDAFYNLDRGLVHILRFGVALEKLNLHF